MSASIPMEVSLTQLSAGTDAETFVATAPDGRSVVHVYGPRSAWRGPQAALVDAAVLRLVRGVVPVAEVLEVRVATGEAPALLVTTELEGLPGDQVLARCEAELLEWAGRQLGAAAARIASVPMVRRGVFAAEDLRLADFPSATAPGECLEAVEAAHTAGAFAGWTSTRLRGLGAIAGRAGQVMADGEDHLGGTACLSHGELAPDNVLLDRGSGALVGVVDWENAHAGVPWTDLGTLLRGRRGHDADVFSRGVLAGWRDAVRLVDPPGALQLLNLARAADVMTLARLSGSGEEVSQRLAIARLAAMADARDLHALPSAAE